MNYTRADVSNAKLDSNDHNSSKTQRSFTSRVDLRPMTAKVKLLNKKIKDFRISEKMIKTELTDKETTDRKSLALFQTMTSQTSDQMPASIKRPVKPKNLYKVNQKELEKEESDLRNPKALVGPEVNLKTHYSDLAHISVNRLRKQTLVLENERRKLGEFFIQPTKEMLLQDATSMIHMEDYLNSMDTCVLVF